MGRRDHLLLAATCGALAICISGGSSESDVPASAGPAFSLPGESLQSWGIRASDGAPACAPPVGFVASTRPALTQQRSLGFSPDLRTLFLSERPAISETLGYNSERFAAPAAPPSEEAVVSPEPARLWRLALSGEGFLLRTRHEPSGQARCRWATLALAPSLPLSSPELSVSLLTLGGGYWESAVVQCDPVSYGPGGTLRNSAGSQWDSAPYCFQNGAGELLAWTRIESFRGRVELPLDASLPIRAAADPATPSISPTPNADRWTPFGTVNRGAYTGSLVRSWGDLVDSGGGASTCLRPGSVIEQGPISLELSFLATMLYGEIPDATDATGYFSAFGRLPGTVLVTDPTARLPAEGGYFKTTTATYPNPAIRCRWGRAVPSGEEPEDTGGPVSLVIVQTGGGSQSYAENCSAATFAPGGLLDQTFLSRGCEWREQPCCFGNPRDSSPNGPPTYTMIERYQRVPSSTPSVTPRPTRGGAATPSSSPTQGDGAPDGTGDDGDLEAAVGGAATPPASPKPTLSPTPSTSPDPPGLLDNTAPFGYRALGFYEGTREQPWGFVLRSPVAACIPSSTTGGLITQNLTLAFERNAFLSFGAAGPSEDPSGTFTTPDTPPVNEWLSQLQGRQLLALPRNGTGGLIETSAFAPPGFGFTRCRWATVWPNGTITLVTVGGGQMVDSGPRCYLPFYEPGGLLDKTFLNSSQRCNWRYTACCQGDPIGRDPMSPAASSLPPVYTIVERFQLVRPLEE